MHHAYNAKALDTQSACAPTDLFTNHRDQLTCFILTSPVHFVSVRGGGNRYFVILVDDFSRYIHIFHLKTQSQFCQVFINFVKMIEAKYGRGNVVSQLLADSALYFEKSIPLQEFCRQKGIIQIFSPPYTHPVVERSG